MTNEVFNSLGENVEFTPQYFLENQNPKWRQFHFPQHLFREGENMIPTIKDLLKQVIDEKDRKEIFYAWKEKSGATSVFIELKRKNHDF